MTRIPNLPTVTTANTGDYIPVFTTGSINAKMTVGQLGTAIADSFVNPTFTLQSASVTTGNIVAVTAAANTWLILTTTSISTLSIRLPDSLTAFDGQEVIITIDGAVVSLSIGANGCDTNGQPSSCNSDGLGVRMRFNAATFTWFCITNHGDSFDSVRLDSGIRDSSSNEVVDVVSSASAVNQVGVANAATGVAPIISARGDDANVGLTVTSKNNGAMNVISPTGDVNVTATAGNIIADVTALGTAAFRVGGVSRLAVDATGATVAGVMAATTVKLTPTVFASLGSAVTAGAGAVRYITDSASVVFHANSSPGGGAGRVMVVSDGTNWLVGG